MRKISPIITLTTDFGTKDNYAGSLKGAILQINPSARIVDITHEIPSFDIAEGAYQLGTCYSLYPKGTIHVAVVDPGVGSRRLPILIKTAHYYFVGPDNGLFSMVCQREKVQSIYQLKNSKFFRKEVSSTFHGRDIFSPVAAHLSLGITAGKLGPSRKKVIQLPLFYVKNTKNQILGQILNIDKFGNATLNLTHKDFKKFIRKKPFRLKISHHQFSRLNLTYSDVPLGKPVLIVGSKDLLETALHRENLAKKWRLKRGERFKLTIG